MRVCVYKFVCMCVQKRDRATEREIGGREGKERGRKRGQGERETKGRSTLFWAMPRILRLKTQKRNNCNAEKFGKKI